MHTTTEADRGLSPISASDLLRALDAAPSAPEPERSSAWEAPSAAPIPDSVLYEPLDLPRYTATELAEACARTADALQAQHAAQRRADALHPPIQVTPYRGAHIVRHVRETSDVWAVFAAAAVLCASAGWHLGSGEAWTGAAVLVVIALVAWARR